VKPLPKICKAYQDKALKILFTFKDKIIETELFIINALLFVIVFMFHKKKNDNTNSNKGTNNNKNTNNNINTITINIIKYP